jgi:hypothetical protein
MMNTKNTKTQAATRFSKAQRLAYQVSASVLVLAGLLYVLTH